MPNDHALFQALFSTLSGLWPLWLMVALAAVLTTPRAKGAIGEALVNWAARRRLDPETYRLIKDVTLPLRQGGTTQIDHIIVSPYGVFVIETKNMRGSIYGRAEEHTWTQRFGRQSFLFQNPLRQNYKHTKTLADLLELDANQIHSLVVFVGGGSFRNEMPPNVTRGMGYIRYIQSKTETVLSPNAVADIVARIENGRLAPTAKTRREHVAHVKAIQEEKKRQPPSPRCPRCGGPMSERTVKTGEKKGDRFWGCNHFPRCRGTRQIGKE